jgi:chemotaxis protein histidine kinase CheA
MSAREQLDAYIAQLEQRLRWSTVLRGFAILTGGALVATLVLVAIANTLAFSQGSVTAARFALILILAIAAAAGLALPLRRLTRRRAVGTAEVAFPQFQQRLTTFTERDGHDPFIELLAGDTLGVAQSAEPKEFVTDRRLWTSLAAGVGAFAILLWMIAAGPGFLGYGASLLWTGPHRDKPALYDLRVTPGDAVVRRHADQMVSALPTGLSSPNVKVHARYQSSSKWEEIAMQPKAFGSFAGGYEFLFAGLPENVEYYVTAGAMTSKHFSIRVTDLPAVTKIRVTYHYPSWTGMPSEVEERGGDLRAVAGTEAELDVTTDRPLPGGQLQLDNGPQIQLTGGQNNVYHGAVKMDRDGVYHVAGVDQGQPVRVSEDFFIEARKANPPQISLARPGHDYHASPIEEVTAAVKATDEYGLHDLALHYSVNGGAETSVDLLHKKGAKQADGSTTLALENFKLVPGDLVSVYATAKDGNSEAHTDMMFIQADPYEREFSQSQVSGGGGGGGGGGGDPSAEISQREKEIISQTFKQQGDKNSTQQQAADIAKLLSQSQSTLHDQAVTLSGRLEARELTDEVKAIGDFQKDMLAASQAMQPAAQQLQQQKWKDAIPNEQKALQSLLRAEATFRQIQVAFGAQGGGGGGGGGAARDLAQLFELELDTQKNQYETPKSASSSAEQKARDIDDALKKLDELAKREEDLAQQQRNGTQTAEQKWQQEMLQREAEQLQQEMQQQLSQNGQKGQSQQSGQSSSSSGSSSGESSSSQSGKSGQQSAEQPADSRMQAAQQALDRLRQANEDMKRAVSQSASAAASRRAADRLREATDLLGGLQQQDAAGRLNSMAQTAEQLATRQKQQADQVRDLMAQQNAARTTNRPQKYPTPQEIEKMVNDRQRVSDDLSHLTQQLRDAARELSSTQPAASGKLRSALEGADESDLGTRMQRSSDQLRSGQFSDPAETALTSDLQKLGQQVGDAARALGSAQHGSEEAEINRAMDDLSRLRDELGRLGQGQRGQAGQRGGQPNGQPAGQPAGQAGGQQFQPGQLSRDGQSGQSGQPGQNGQSGQQAGQAGGGQVGGPVGNRIAGPVGNPGGGVTNGRGNVNGGYDMGNTRISGQAVAPQQGPNPADTQRQIDQGLNLLNGVRTVVQDSPEARRELQSLIDQMRNLDPSRFPGNPGLVEQMHQQLLSNVDALELQLRRQLDEKQGGTIRNTDPAKIPAGYQDSVAEYYRKLSTAGH